MLKENKVYVYDCKHAEYPKEKPYHPSNNYPEYPFKDLAAHENYVYDSIRELFNLMKLDRINFETKKWNPLKDIIKKGDKVILKPNMVIHENESRPMEGLMTHGSIIRAMIDYTFIALKGEGEIVVADAPIQSCNFEKIIEDNGLREIIEFYNKRKGNVKISIMDFRKEQAGKIKNTYITIEKKLSGDPLGYTAIDFGELSAFEGVDRNYTITNYDPKIMNEHHGNKKHEYLIPNTLLSADVVINLPKPKTHRKAGMTACLKNIVGISGNKAWLPHHSIGSKGENGDEYINKNIFRRITGHMIVKRDLASLKKNFKLAKLYSLTAKITKKMSSLTNNKDVYIEGSWWGNDTIWRTVCDLNRVVFYADKKGELKTTVQRKYFNLCDMIISGEKEGPVKPTPKKVGLLVASTSPLITDSVISSIMSFDYKKIPNIIRAFEIKKLPLTKVTVDKISIISNNGNFNKKFNKMEKNDGFNFIPTSGWKKHIEKGVRK